MSDDDTWETELEAVECIVDTKNISFSDSTTRASVSIQVLYGNDDMDDEFWVQFFRLTSYPNEALVPFFPKSSTNLGTPVDVDALGAELTNAAAELAEVGSEALFVLVTAAKEFVERCIEQDSQAALRALEKIDAANDGPIMKRVSHDPDLVQVYRALDLTQTTVLLTKCTDQAVLKTLYKNIASSIQLYSMIHGVGVWTYLTLDGLWEVGFDSKDKSFAARRFKERQQAVQKAKKRQLLWHGSALSSIACILTNGSLRKVQRAAHGRMFGDGVYFADCMCKSLTYCSGGAENEVYLLLCSVDLDQEYPTNQYFEDVDPEILDSGVPLAVHGNLEMKEYSKFESGDRMATGGCKWRGQICTVNFNEFIVFKEDGHVNKYLVRLKVKDDGMTKRRIYGR
uniref:Poly [ADP-ribose] polymerase n=1 Tax=Eutreptiella gymnastica TaxID=73025 RepID=A0A7S4GIU0_9EUGL